MDCEPTEKERERESEKEEKRFLCVWCCAYGNIRENYCKTT